MRPYNGRWLDSFNVSVVEESERPGVKGKILLETPSEDYFFTKEQWEEFKVKVNEV